MNVQFIKPDFLARDQSLQADIGAVKQSLEAYDQEAVIADLLLSRKFSRPLDGRDRPLRRGGAHQAGRRYA